MMDELLVTVSGMLLSFTVGTVLPKFAPVMVSWFATKSAVALFMTTWPGAAACTRTGVPASVRPTTATMNVIREYDFKNLFPGVESSCFSRLSAAKAG